MTNQITIKTVMDPNEIKLCRCVIDKMNITQEVEDLYLAKNTYAKICEILEQKYGKKIQPCQIHGHLTNIGFFKFQKISRLARWQEMWEEAAPLAMAKIREGRFSLSFLTDISTNIDKILESEENSGKVSQMRAAQLACNLLSHVYTKLVEIVDRRCPDYKEVVLSDLETQAKDIIDGFMAGLELTNEGRSKDSSGSNR